MGAIDPQVCDQFGPKGLDLQDLCRGLLHTKYISCGPHGFREEDYSITSLCELLISRLLKFFNL